MDEDELLAKLKGAVGTSEITVLCHVGTSARAGVAAGAPF
jgi:hypothetical protein